MGASSFPFRSGLQFAVTLAEGVTFVHVSAVQALSEPAHTLSGSSVVERIRNGISLCLLLQIVVTDLRSYIQAFFNVTVFQ